MKKWYLIATKPRQEKIAIVNLENQNYHVYCPKTTLDQKNVFLFPGYLFIQLDEKIQNWSPVKSTKGVVNFVRFGLYYANISDKIIDIIRANEMETAKKIITLNDFKIGESVLITEGVFKNFIAIFKSYKSDERVLLLLSLMGQQQTINIKKKSLIGL